MRLAIVIALPLLSAALWVPNLVTAGDGCLGYQTGVEGLVTEVNCAAQRAGIVPGDRIEFWKLPLDQRYIDPRDGPPGTKVTVPVLHHGMERRVTLVADYVRWFDPRELPVILMERVSHALLIVIAAFILLRRPNRVTWAFYLYAVGSVGIHTRFYSFLPTLAFYGVQYASYLSSFAAQLALVVFALRFPRDRVEGWRAAGERWVPYAFALLAVYLALVYALNMLGIVTGYPIGLLEFGGSIPVYLWIWYALVRSYSELRESERLRVGSVMLGVGAATAIWIIAYTNYPLQYMSQSVMANVRTASDLVVCVAVGYAILRHRVFDFDFVLNRTIVFGTIALAGAALFAGLDSIFVDVLPRSRADIALALGVSLLFGYAAAEIFRGLTVAVDRTLFPRRRAIVQALSELRIAIERNASEEENQKALTSTVANVLFLASAAIFRSERDGGFIRQASSGWPSRSVWHLLHADEIVRRISASPTKPMRIDGFSWRDIGVPDGAGRPVLLVPLSWRRRTRAIALYGAHSNGAAIAPDELRALGDLCAAAAPSFERHEPRPLPSPAYAHE